QTYTLSPALTTAFNLTNVAATADTIIAQAEGYYISAVGNDVQFDLGTGADGSQAQYSNLPLSRPTDPQGEGGTVGAPYGSGIDNLATIQQVVADSATTGFAAT